MLLGCRGKGHREQGPVWGSGKASSLVAQAEQSHAWQARGCTPCLERQHPSLDQNSGLH